MALLAASRALAAAWVAMYLPFRADGLLARSPNATATALTDYFLPKFQAPKLTPTQFLFVSSPSEHKVVYTELKNFKSTSGRTFALIDSGLSEPAGLAFDHNRGFLYVADRGAHRIYRYRVLVQERWSSSGKVYSLATDGVQLCVIMNAAVEFVSVDISGDVFYSDQTKNTINRIPADTIDRLAEGAYQCSDLRIKSEKVQMQEAMAEAAELDAMTDAQREDVQPTDAPNTEPVVFSVYESALNPHVTAPTGVASDGARLYWTNKLAGQEAGVLVQGKVQPELPPSMARSANAAPVPFASKPMASDISGAYGVATSTTMVFYSANHSGSGYVYGLVPGGQPHAFVSNLISPRGLCWDGDNTLYVADERGNSVFSLPVGRLMDDAPLTQSAALTGAFGVALFTLPTGVAAAEFFARSAAGSRLLSGPLSATLHWLLPLAAARTFAAAAAGA